MNPKKEVERKELEMFIGENQDKILDKSTNFAAAILGPIWFFYRKCYKVGFFLSLIEFLCIFLLNIFFPISYFSYIIFPIFFFFFGNKIYISHIKRKIKKGKNKEGKVSILGAILFTFLTFFLLNGVYKITPYFIRNIHKMDDMILVSNTFVKDEKTGFLKAEESCYLDAGKLKKEGESLLYNYYGIKKDFSNLEKVKINAKNWYTNKKEDREEYFMELYLYKKGNTTYIAKFFSNNKTNYDVCKKIFQKEKEKLYIIGG